MDRPNLIPLEKAAERLGIARGTMWVRVKEWKLAVYDNPVDKRQRLLDWDEVERAVAPRLRKPAPPAEPAP